jgi:hypothetical protein
MARVSEEGRADFDQAIGEEFGEAVSPPIPFEDASPHECCEVVRAIAGRDVTPRRLADLSATEMEDLARRFGAYFDSEPPRVEQIREAVGRTLARWPVGSLGE